MLTFISGVIVGIVLTLIARHKYDGIWYNTGYNPPPINHVRPKMPTPDPPMKKY